MTTTTDTLQPTASAGRPRWLPRFALAFVLGLAAALALGAGAIYAYSQQYAGRVLPGVHAAGVDLSGSDRETAIAMLEQALAGFGQGRVVVDGGVGTYELAYADFGRRADAEAMVDAALAVGRGGSPVDQGVAHIRTVIHGVDVPLLITLDEAALQRRITAGLRAMERSPVDATIALGKSGYDITPASIGRAFDETAAASEALSLVASVDAPAEVTVVAPVQDIPPAVGDDDAQLAQAHADRMIVDLPLVAGDERWSIDAKTVRSWISFATTGDGRVEPVADPAAVEATLTKTVAKQIAKPAKNASFRVGKGGTITGVVASANGRALDAATTAERVTAALAARASSEGPTAVEPAITVVPASFTTAQAEQAAPRMRRISTWTTYFPIGEKNGYGANIWIPASDIDGYVLAPGETFDFWKAVGPVTTARGYRAGGAIINGRTEPQGALAGGICSCSTTLFNAAVRAGLDMGARRNHYYYIDRYPLGLDATVYKSGSGSVQTMSFTNDTAYPILIRGINTRNGSRGYVRFDLYGVPTGRTVSFSKPVVKNVRKATTRTELTSSLAPGARKQIEFPADGKDVWVTRTVKDPKGNVIHQETFYSHYSRVDGIILVGAGTTSGSGGGSATPSPSPTAPSPSP